MKNTIYQTLFHRKHTVSRRWTTNQFLNCLFQNWQKDPSTPLLRKSSPPKFWKPGNKISMLSLVSKGRCPNITQIAQQLLCKNKVHYTVQECFNVSFTQANKSVYFRNLISSFSHHYEITIHITVPINPKSPLKVIHTDVK